MDSTKATDSVPLSWKMGIFAPLAVALVLMLIYSGHGNIHRWTTLMIVAQIMVFIAMMAQGAFWIVRKFTWLGILAVAVGGVGVGFGLSVLLRPLF